ncbi:MAG: sigma-E processing peptidase SpoIIGA [Clostridia bacterium]|nr:sigma-E processing peptidase SpoIIGA [Clostridia bacterium]
MNTVITFLLLLPVKQFTGARTGAGRLTLASFAGGLYSLVMLAPEMNVLLALLTKSAMCVSIVFIAFREKKFRKMLRCVLLFSAFSFLYAGIMYFIVNVFGVSFFSVNNGSVYFNINAFSLICICCAVYAGIFFFRKRFFVPSPEDMIYGAKLYYRGNCVSVRALLDTGNSVKDIYTGNPVIILESRNASALTGQAGELAPGNAEIPVRLIPVSSLAAGKLLPAFTAERAVITNGPDEREIKTPCVAVTEDKLGGEKYQALISGDLF